MRRQFRLNRAAGVGGGAVDYEAMSDDDLVVYAIEKGVSSLCVRWKRKTIIRKLDELK